MNLLFDADAAIERQQIRTAPEENMLTVVDHFVDAGMQVGGGRPAEVAAAFDKLHAIAGFREGAGCAHTRNAAADNGDGARVGLGTVRQRPFLGLDPFYFMWAEFGTTEVHPIEQRKVAGGPVKLCPDAD